MTKQIKDERHENKGNDINDSKIRTPQGPTINDKQFPVKMFLLIYYPHTNMAQLSYAFFWHWMLQFSAVEYKHPFADSTLRVVRSMWQKNTLKEIIQAKSLLASQMFLPQRFKLEHIGNPARICCNGDTVTF